MSHPKKRVRFSEDGPAIESVPSTSEGRNLRDTLLPKPEEAEDFQRPFSEESEGPIKATDPGFAAAFRARHRKEIDNLKAGEALDISLLDDVALAEEQEDDPELRFTEDGIPIEPFNLRAERAQGFFDVEGNYLAYRDADDTDAWLDSLPAGPTSAGDRKAKKKLPDDNVEGRPEMTDTDRNNYRQRIVKQLQPGESVLEALKRLGTSDAQNPIGYGCQGETKAEKLAAVRSRISGTVPVGNREAFEALTEDAGQLLNAGDTNVYTETREKLLTSLRPRQGSTRSLQSSTEPARARATRAYSKDSASHPITAADLMDLGEDEPAAPELREAVDRIEDIFGDGQGADTPATAAAEPRRESQEVSTRGRHPTERCGINSGITGNPNEPDTDRGDGLQGTPTQHNTRLEEVGAKALEDLAGFSFDQDSAPSAHSIFAPTIGESRKQHYSDR